MLPAGWHALHRSGRRPRLRSRFSCCDGRCRTARAACGDQRRQHLAGAVQCGDRCAVAAFSALHEIRMVIAPAQGTPLGLATVRAVLSYCGTPFSWWQAGRWQQVVGWAQPTRVHFAQLAPRLASPCDVPDHDLLPQRYPGVQTVEFRAALEVPFCSAVWRSLLGCANVVCRCRCSAWLMYLPKQDTGSIVSGPTWAACAWSCVAPAIPQRGKPTVAAALGPHCSDAARPGNPLFRGHFTDSQTCRRQTVAGRCACLPGTAHAGRVRAGICCVANAHCSGASRCVERVVQAVGQVLSVPHVPD